MNILRWRGGLSLILVFVGTALPLGKTSPAQGSAGDAPTKEVWYTPKEADFRGAYDRDAANQKTQTWAQYWGWIKAFYEGNFLSAGWTQRMSPEVAEVSSNPTRAALVDRLNQVGIRIAQEWAKEDAVRRINTNDLKRWHAEMSQARAADDGSGARLKAAIQAVEDEVKRKLGK